MIKAVLFDYDGVLVNSMPFHVKAWQHVFSDYGITLQPEEVLLREGSRAIELGREIFAARAVQIPDGELVKFVAKKQRKYREISQAEVENGAESFICKLKRQGLLIGLVTGSARRNVEFLLPTKLLSLFDTVITNEETQNGKPNPECFLKAARALAVPPEQCLAVENAPLGIQAAKSAGMKVVAFTTTLEKSHLNGADFYADDLSELEVSWEKLLS